MISEVAVVETVEKLGNLIKINAEIVDNLWNTCGEIPLLFHKAYILSTSNY
jgi:hypothetical protein